MKYLTLFLLMGCLTGTPELKPGDCVLGRGMALWQLKRSEGGKHMFVAFPLQNDTKVEIVEDISTYKKVECHEPK